MKGTKEEKEFLIEDFEDDTCPNCSASSDLRKTIEGKSLCSQCGFVFSEADMIDFTPEWREFSNEESKKTRGVNKSFDATQNPNERTIILENKESSQFRKWQQKFLPTGVKERNKRVILENLKNLSEQVYVSPEILQESNELIQSILQKTLIRGRSIRTITAACVCVTLRKNNIPRTVKEISSKLGISKKELGRSVKFVKSNLGLKTQPVSPINFLRRFISAFKIDPSAEEELAWYYENLVKEKVVVGKGPVSIAGAIFFFFLRKYRHQSTQSAFLEKTTITEVTLKFINSQIKDHLVRLSEEFDKLHKKGLGSTEL